MDLLQEILVFITFALAVGYIFTKFIYKPKFLLNRIKRSEGETCGVGCGSCH